MEKTKNKGQRIGLKLLIFIFGMTTAFAQKSVSINSEKIFQEQGSNPRSRAFEVNPQLQNFSQNNVGDKLLLDFFDDKQYEAVVLQVSKSYDGIVGITAQVANTQFGYCYISVAGNNIALSAELPQKNEFFSVKKINGKYYLTEQTLSEVQHEHSGECSHVPESGSSAQLPMLRASVSTPTLPESSAAVTVDILVVYTPAAKAVAIANGSDIDSDIAVGIQRANQALSNSQTNVTLNLVHKQEVNYTEGNSTNTELVRLRSPEDGYADEVHALRTQYNADLVVLLVGENTSGVAGAGYIINNEYGNSKAGFSVVKAKHINAGYVLIHEVGHNFGCGHHVNTDNESLYSYSHGYGSSANSFSTIMTYDNLGFGTRIPYFSDPAITNNGVAVGAADANNAKTIRQTKGLIAAYSGEAIYYDAFLKDITLSSGALSPAFNPGVYQYTVNVSNSVANIDVEGIRNSSYATVTGNATAKSLNVGNNTVVIKVEDGWQNYEKTYTVTVNRASQTLSNDATLSSLTVNQGTLSPNFNSGTIAYTVSVGNAVTSITLTATKAHAAASVSGDGAKSLNVGANAFPVVVTAEDGTTKKTYTVTVNRAAPTLSNNANLSSLTVNQGTLSPNFNSGTIAYTVSVGNAVTSITLTATKAHAAASVSGDGAKSLNVGANTFPVVVTAEDGTTKTYTVTVNRASPTLSNDATLSSLSVNQGTLTPSFNANTTNYSVSVANSVSSITISAIANHNCCKCVGTGSKLVSVGSNPFNIVCTAEDGTMKTYTVTVNRAPLSSYANLSSLAVNRGTLMPNFTSGTTAYTVNVGNSVTSITLTATAVHPGASVAGNGVKPLNVGANIFDIVGTAEDGTTTKTYTVTVNRNASGTAIESPEENSDIKVWSANGMLHIDSPSDEITLVRVYDFDGKLIKTFQPQANQFETANPHGLRIAIIVIETSQNRKYSKKMVLL
ncbi:hypothetical protein AGMMS4957_17050 [Bacteroidia bacterium]|nr:hypothetical protein AGMMS4957_17050 [Bacteroidia bacterium]